MNSSEFSDLLNSSNGDIEALFAGLAVFIIFMLVICLFIVIFKVISRWIFFKKCGEEGWKALIPFYTDYTVIKIAGLNWWWVLILFTGTILSSMNSVINVLEESDLAPDIAVFAVLISILSIFGSIATLFARINVSYNISKKFNKNGGYAVLIFLFEPIMFFVLGLSKSDDYDESIQVSPNGFIGNKSSKSIVYCPDCGNEVKQDYCPNCGKKVR